MPCRLHTKLCHAFLVNLFVVQSEYDSFHQQKHVSSKISGYQKLTGIIDIKQSYGVTCHT